MENNDIKKALEHCIKDSTCEQCQLSPFTCHIQENALALINSQEQRIKELTVENERLVRANSAINNAVLAVDRMAKSDTVRKMCQQIKEHFPYDADSGLYVVLDQIAKEMLEGENED